jgi:rhodanese-related sulfurtransferase
MKKLPLFLTLIMLITLLAACGTAEKPLPSAEPDENSQFGVDKNINVGNIDSWLGRDDVVYRDVRMLFDPADFSAIGGEADLTHTIEGFKIVPYPFIGTLSELPVSGAYDGDHLFAVKWADGGSVASATANYDVSMQILEELFPKDKAIFLMCGGGGYSGMMKSLLIFLGWDASKLYNIGGNWSYKGTHSLELVIFPEKADGNRIYATWRADYAFIDFTRLHRTGDAT